MNIDNTDKLHNNFPKLTDNNQNFIIGLIEGLKHAQSNKNNKEKQLKTLDNVIGVNSAFYNSSLGRKTCS